MSGMYSINIHEPFQSWFLFTTCLQIWAEFLLISSCGWYHKPLFLSVFCLLFGSSGFGCTAVQCIFYIPLGSACNPALSRFCPGATIVNKRRPFLCPHCNWLQIRPSPCQLTLPEWVSRSLSRIPPSLCIVSCSSDFSFTSERHSAFQLLKFLYSFLSVKTYISMKNFAIFFVCSFCESFSSVSGSLSSVSGLISSVSVSFS